MSNKLYEENDIQNIANAIRNKNGTEDTYKVSQMSTAINSIEIIEQATAEGESLNLVNAKAMPYKDYVVEGKSEQDGEPSPSIPSDIHSVADDVNLLQNNATTTTVNGITFTVNSDGTVIANGTATAQATIDIGRNLENIFNGKYIISGSPKGSSSSTYYMNLFKTENGTVTSIGAEYGNGITTEQENDCYLWTRIVIVRGQTVNNLVFKPKLQKGSTSTSYSPYNQGTVTIKQRGTTESNDYTIQTSPLRSLPNGIKDTIEDDGIHRRVGRVVLDGTENGWSYSGSSSSPTNRTVIVESYLIQANSDYFLSNRFIKGSETSNRLVIAGYDLNGIYISLDDTLTAIESSDSNSTKIQKIKTWLSNNPTEVLYPLATEIIEPLTQNQATTMLDIIKTGSYEGTTNIYTDEDVKPTIKADYYKKG